MARVVAVAFVAAMASALKEVPLFPLRKASRVPTDSLVLNLFEPRYLAMAERVLGTDGVFGAMQCQGPHVLPRGRGPAEPLIAAGAVGALFRVDRSETTRDGRVRLEATAFGRLAVRRVVSTPANRASSLPYLVVDAAPVADQRTGPNDALVADAEAAALAAFDADGKLETPAGADVRRYAAADPEVVAGYADFCADRSELLSFALVRALDADKGRALRDRDTARRLARAVAGRRQRRI